MYAGAGSEMTDAATLLVAALVGVGCVRNCEERSPAYTAIAIREHPITIAMGMRSCGLEGVSGTR